MEQNEDTGWNDSGHGYMERTFKFKAPKPFSMDDLKNTWFMSVPDGKGNVTNTGGKWVDGKMVEDFRETVSDPLHGFMPKMTIGTVLPKCKWTDNEDSSKQWELI